MAIVGYIRVSTDKQNYDGQKLSILNYANDQLKGRVDEWIEVKASTRKSAEKRKLDELRETLKKGRMKGKPMFLCFSQLYPVL